MVKDSKAPLHTLTWKYLQDILSEKFKVYNGVIIEHYHFIEIKLEMNVHVYESK